MQEADCTLLSQGYGWEIMLAGQMIASHSILEQFSQPVSLVDSITHSTASNTLEPFRDWKSTLFAIKNTFTADFLLPWLVYLGIYYL